MRRVAQRGLDGAPWHGAWPEFHRRAARRGAKEGDGFGRVPSAVAGRVRNGFLPRRREANVWGPQGAGAHLTASRGSRRCGPTSPTRLG
jgi:hypothetical protein